jgi:hypothetical protein
MNQPDKPSISEDRLRKFLAQPHQREIRSVPSMARIKMLADGARPRAIVQAWVCGFIIGTMSMAGVCLFGLSMLTHVKALGEIMPILLASISPLILSVIRAVTDVLENPSFEAGLAVVVLSLLLVEIKLYFTAHRRHLHS